MKDLQLAVRGSEQALAEKPLTIFSCCPTAPIKWSDVTSQNLVDCARWSIPVEFISMPLSGFMAPVTLVGSLVQQTAETLSGVVISQLTRPGHPILYGGSPAIFDVRYETTPMGAVETMMLDCANSEIGKRLGMPTQGYIALSDAKQLDAQAGLETAMGATAGGAFGHQQHLRPGHARFRKLPEPGEAGGGQRDLRHDLPAAARASSRARTSRRIPIFQELLREKHLLIADHTRRHLRQEITVPRPGDRPRQPRALAEGRRADAGRARRARGRAAGREVSALAAGGRIQAELTRLMTGEARRHGMEKLPPRDAAGNSR